MSPANGKAISLKNVPDKTFSEELLGKGIAVDPEDGVVVSPVDGKVTLVFDTKHAIAIQTSDGVELLIHIGIDTVRMNGKGFNAFVKTGDTVKKGNKLVEFDLNLVKEEAESSIIMVVVTNSDSMKFIKSLKYGKVKQGDELALIGVN
ncbi:PTS glucose transporter subunit IIA [Clostridium sp.]|uniref:PTS sugar transporter subunit IIA n=1 Tax=Clostridium sp. TaxID=1506 RepID=UPI00258D0F54|nr:PTS glucose transporter subunit IIA [Clostridium sp.]